MNESTEPGKAIPPEQGSRDELTETINLLQASGLAVADLFNLFQVELRLAAHDTKRLLMISLLILPVLFLAWIGISTMLFWLVFQQTTSVAYGLFAFTALQLLALFGIRLQIKKYRRSLGLPATSKQVKAFAEGVRRAGTQSTDT